MGWAIQGWGGSCRDEVGWVISVWGGNYRVLNLEMPQGIKSDRIIMKLQVTESLTPKY